MKSSKPSSPLWRFAIQLFFGQTSASLLTLTVFFLFTSFITAEDVQHMLLIALCVIATVYFLIFQYNTSVAFGQRDYNLVKYGHITETKLKGLIAGALAQIPGAVLVILTLVTPPETAAQTGSFFVLLNYYLAFIGNLYIMAAVAAALTPLLGWIGYRNGFRKIDIWSKILYKNPDRKRTDRRTR